VGSKKETDMVTVLPTRFRGPSFEGFVFILKSDSAKPKHTLTITSQASIDIIIASIQGTWQGDGPNPKSFTGTIFNLNHLSVTLSWANGMSGHNTLTGKLTHLAPSDVLEQNLWRLDGSVTAYDANNNPIAGGPGNVSGNGEVPLVSPPALP
jgi:hypothetical protein